MTSELNMTKAELQKQIDAERQRQHEKHGEDCDIQHDLQWWCILSEEVGEVIKALNQGKPELATKEIISVMGCRRGMAHESAGILSCVSPASIGGEND